MLFVFVSNYLNHHQIPFCDAMCALTKGSFAFIQTEPVEQERIDMGWNAVNGQSYLHLCYEDPEGCQRLIDEAKVVMFGGLEDQSCIEGRLASKKPVLRYTERIYKTGQWRFVSPRGLIRKYKDHIRHRRDPVYMLCSGGYTAGDFGLIHAYPGKMYCWGYFTETKHYELDELMAGKGSVKNKVPEILWAARMIPLKHPELAVETARYLKEKGLDFHMNIIGDGELRAGLEELCKTYGLEGRISFPGFLKPGEVREYMERADIFLFTSNRIEGWGAVMNESMNSGCAVVADHMIGSVPFLVSHGENGLIYRYGDKGQLFEMTERLVRDREYCRQLGRNAYRTITETWNPENGALQLAGLCLRLGILDREDLSEAVNPADLGKVPKNSRGRELFAPCLPAKVIPERKMYGYLHAE